MDNPSAARAVVILRASPSVSDLGELHRLLGLGLTEIRHRAQTTAPLVDAELFGNDHADVAQTLHTLLDTVAELDHTVHVCLGPERPGPCNEETPEVLRNMLATAASDRAAEP
ncbi:hypothetical protein ACWCXX_34300 [Streptomyces sp. NPDC001732]